jgi:hypothetical protein
MVVRHRKFLAQRRFRVLRCSLPHSRVVVAVVVILLHRLCMAGRSAGSEDAHGHPGTGVAGWQFKPLRAVCQYRDYLERQASGLVQLPPDGCPSQCSESKGGESILVGAVLHHRMRRVDCSLGLGEGTEVSGLGTVFRSPRDDQTQMTLPAP